MGKEKTMSWSFDISTTNVGISLWDSLGNLLEIKHLGLDLKSYQKKMDLVIPAEDRDLYKAEMFKSFIIRNKERIENDYDGVIENIFVEAPLPSTGININTTALLLGFNGMARYALFNVFGFAPIKISVHDSRKLFCPELIKLKKVKGVIKETLSFPKGVDKKLYLWEKVAKLEPQITWFYTRNNTLKGESFDMSDSYVVGIAGLIVLGIVDVNKWSEINKKSL